MNFEELTELIKRYNQEHLLKKYNEFKKEDKEQAEEFLNEINRIDFPLMKSLYDNALLNEDADKKLEIEPVEYTDKEKMTYSEKEKYIAKGKNLLKEGKLAAVTMAGGQGTRLGHNKPKGTYDFGVNKSLFEIFCDNLKETFRKVGSYTHWYIMTSRENNKDTIDFFEENDYFGYPKNYIHFFIQDELPMMGEDGAILIDEHEHIKFAADGHGGTLYAMEKSGIIDEMNKYGVEYIFISGVDNCLANPTDPLFIGFAKDANADIVVKSIEKIDPKENVGVFCKKNGKIGVVEYSEISEKMANLKDDYGSLVYGDSNSLLHIFSINILNELTRKPIPYHTAHKKASYINKDGKIIHPEEPNAFKFERFIFDAFEKTDNIKILRVQREDEFAPLKNKIGQDSPKTAKKLYLEHLTKTRAYDRYDEWLNDSAIDNLTKEELRNIKENDYEIRDRFYKELEFGTAGLRGIIGAGTNRMNKYTVAKATQGIANYIIKNKLDKKPVVIAYDVRRFSKEFADITARCFNANGIKTYIFKSIEPVPMLSFSTRQMDAVAGIMITASHNPPEYNGYKVFWSKGSQIVGKVGDKITEAVNDVNSFSDIKTISLEKAKEEKLYIELGDSLSNQFMRNVQAFMINDEKLKDEKEKIKIVYSPIHGTGIVHIPKLFEKMGYKNVYIVPEQEMPNAYFPTVEKPNPEEIRANDMAINLAKKIDADYTITTDPDTDRIGISVRDKSGQYVMLSGNEMGILFTDYVLSQKAKKDELKDNSVVISTVVSTRLTKEIANKYNVKYLTTLTGFKYIGELINQFEEEKTLNFQFGFEESYGYLYGTNARDKDAVSATMLAAEMFAYYKKDNKTLLDRLEEIYKEFGYYISINEQLILTGEEGQEKISDIMNALRRKPITEIDGIKTKIIRDYKTSENINLLTNEKGKEDLPKSNVILYEMEDGSWFAVRPSGTEPKLKFYCEVKGKTESEAKEKSKKLKYEISKIKSLADDSDKTKIVMSKKK